MADVHHPPTNSILPPTQPDLNIHSAAHRPQHIRERPPPPNTRIHLPTPRPNASSSSIQEVLQQLFPLLLVPIIYIRRVQQYQTY